MYNNRIFLSLPRGVAGSSDESSAQASAAPATTMPHKYLEQTSASSSSPADQTQTRAAQASTSPEPTSESSPAAERTHPVAAATTHLQSEKLTGSSREHTAAAPVVGAANVGLASDLNLEQFALSNALALSGRLLVFWIWIRYQIQFNKYIIVFYFFFVSKATHCSSFSFAVFNLQSNLGCTSLSWVVSQNLLKSKLRYFVGLWVSELSHLCLNFSSTLTVFQILKTSKGKRATSNTLNQKLGELYIMRWQAINLYLLAMLAFFDLVP